jgi:hypothetical protein
MIHRSTIVRLVAMAGLRLILDYRSPRDLPTDLEQPLRDKGGAGLPRISKRI